MVLTATGTTALLWKNRPKPLHGSRKFHEMFQALRPSFSGVLKPARHRVRRVFHSTGWRSTSMPTSLRFFWMSSFMARGSIWPEPEVEIRCTAFAGCLLASNPAWRLGRIVAVGLLRLPKPRVPRVDDTGGGYAGVVQEVLADADPVDGVVRRLSDELVVPRLLVESQGVRPVVRIAVQGNGKAGALELGNGVGRWHLDPVDLTAAQRGEARGRLRHGQEHELVDLRPALDVPIGLVGLQLEPLAGHELGHAEGAGAGRLLGKLAPVLELLPLGRRHDQHVAELIGHEARRLVRLELHRVVIDLAHSDD